MAAPKGNRYGIDSGNFFNPKKYTPQKLGEKFVEYLKDRNERKWIKQEPIKSGDKAGTTFDIEVTLPLTIRSFAVFAGITRQTLLNYESKDEYKEFFEVTTHIRDIIEADQIDGATVGAYNPNIIARLMGLAEKSEIKQTNIKPPSIEFTD